MDMMWSFDRDNGRTRSIDHGQLLELEYRPSSPFADQQVPRSIG